MTFIWEEGTVFKAAVGSSSMVAGTIVRTQHMEVLVGAERVANVVEVGVKDVDGERVGTLRFGERRSAPEDLSGDVAIVVRHPADHTVLRQYGAAGCNWTRDEDRWCFRGQPA